MLYHQDTSHEKKCPKFGEAKNLRAEWLRWILILPVPRVKKNARFFIEFCKKILFEGSTSIGKGVPDEEP